MNESTALALPIMLLLALCGCDDGPRRDGDGSIVSAGVIDAFAVQMGDCFNDPPPTDPQVADDGTRFEAVSTLAGVPCDQPHDNEIFAVFDSALAAFPGPEAMDELAMDACIARFPEYVGRDYITSGLATFAVTPTPASWEQDGDREIICVLFDMQYDLLEGSMRGSGR